MTKYLSLIINNTIDEFWQKTPDGKDVQTAVIATAAADAAKTVTRALTKKLSDNTADAVADAVIRVLTEDDSKKDDKKEQEEAAKAARRTSRFLNEAIARLFMYRSDQNTPPGEYSLRDIYHKYLLSY